MKIAFIATSGVRAIHFVRIVVGLMLASLARVRK